MAPRGFVFLLAKAGIFACARGDGVAQPAFAWYAAKNIRVALATTCSMRSGDGAGAAWKRNGMNSDAWHNCMNCVAASGHRC